MRYKQWHPESQKLKKCKQLVGGLTSAQGEQQRKMLEQLARTEKCRVKMLEVEKTSDSHCQMQLLVSFSMHGASEMMSFVTLSLS